jgi:hypothetical protein
MLLNYKNKTLTCIVKGVMLFAFCISWLEAQNSPSANGQALGFSIIPLVINSGSQSTQITFWVDANDSVAFALGSTRKDHHLIYTDPNGQLWDTAAPPTDALIAFVSPDPLVVPDAPGAVYNAVIDKPISGQWTLTIQTPSPMPSSVSTHLQVIYQNKVAAFMTAAKTSMVSGQELSVTMALLDGGIKQKNLQITAIITKPDDSTFYPVPVTFLDDGTNGDLLENDGTFLSTIQAETPGNYFIQAQIEGTASTGRFHRTCGLVYKVIPKTVQILGTFSQRVVVGDPK